MGRGLRIASIISILATLMYILAISTTESPNRGVFMGIGAFHFLMAIIINKTALTYTTNYLYYIHITSCIVFFASGYIFL